MKKLTFLLLGSMLVTGLFAQSDKYMKAMQEKIAVIDTTHNTEGLLDLANSFERIADAEKTQWLPYYYSAFAHASAGLMMGVSTNGAMGGHADQTDPEADKADALIGKAEALSKDNSEIWIVKKMIATLRMMGDPMTRYMVYGPQAAQALETARKLNPDNPRVYLLEGQDKFYTPEQFGGSKQEAKTLFEEAQKKFEAFKPESSIHPTWGMSQVKWFLSQQ
jgi:hypothetical protein